MTPDARQVLPPVRVTTPPRTESEIKRERDLIEAVLGKDRKAAALFVDQYADGIYGYVRQRLTPRTELVDDIVQDVFIAALRGLGGFSGQSSLRSWLRGIARHKVEDYYRERLRTIGDLNPDDESLPPPASHPAFEERLDRERRTDKTHRILAKLPEPYGLVLLWRYWEKRSTKEMAERTRRTEKAIERLLARARAQFRQLWEAE